MSKKGTCGAERITLGEISCHSCAPDAFVSMKLHEFVLLPMVIHRLSEHRQGRSLPHSLPIPSDPEVVSSNDEGDQP